MLIFEVTAIFAYYFETPTSFRSKCCTLVDRFWSVAIFVQFLYQSSILDSLRFDTRWSVALAKKVETTLTFKAFRPEYFTVVV